jgi:homoserine O-acetyltransferase
MANADKAEFSAKDFALGDGGTLPELTVAYETYGDPANAANNTILLLHGYTSSQHAAGGGPEDPGWWEYLVGSGRAIDTDRHFVVAPNMLGSSYGTTGPRSIDPATGRPYGPDFPAITTHDMVAAQSLLLDHLGADELAAVVGYSYGGYLTYQWAVDHPERMRALVPVATGVTGRGDESMVRSLEQDFAAAPGWNGGHYYSAGEGVNEALINWRVEILRGYGVDQELRDTGLNAADVEAGLRTLAAKWAEVFDPNSLILLRRCAIRFDARPDAHRIQAPLLYVLASTDALFGPELGEPTVAHIREVAGVEASYHELESPYGHRAPSVDWAKWADALSTFLKTHC